MAEGFARSVDFMTRVWGKFSSFIKKTQAVFVAIFAKANNRVEARRNPNFDLEAANAIVQDEFQEEVLQIDIAELEAFEAQEQDAIDRREKAAKDLNDLVAGLADARDKAESARQSKNAKAALAAAKELADLIAKRDALMGKAKDARTKSDARKAAEELAKRKGDGRGATSDASPETRGIFNAAALLSLETARGETEVTRSGKKTVEAINSLSRQVRRNRLQFT